MTASMDKLTQKLANMKFSTAFVWVFLVAALLVFSAQATISFADNRVPDKNGHYHIALPIVHPDIVTPSDAEVWGTSCSDLKVKYFWNKKDSGIENSLFCLPHVDNIVDFLKTGAVVPGVLWFENGPHLITVPHAPASKAEVEKLKQAGRAIALKKYGQLPPDTTWVILHDMYGGYFKFKGVTPCPSTDPKASFCELIDDYASDPAHPKIDDVYGVYCWKNCAHLKQSPQSFQRAVLFGSPYPQAEFYLEGAYAQPLWPSWRRKPGLINWTFMNQLKKGEKDAGQ